MTRKSIFFDHIHLANKKHFRLPEYLEHYTTCLLDDFVTKKIDDRPFALRLMETSSLPFSEQFREFKGIGDESLILLCFFGEKIDRSVNNRDYYRSVGSIGFKKAGEVSGQSWLFDEISESFRSIEDLINTSQKLMKFQIV